MLLYTPVQKIGEEKAGMYYCLRCGLLKEIINKYLVERYEKVIMNNC